MLVESLIFSHFSYALPVWVSTLVAAHGISALQQCRGGHCDYMGYSKADKNNAMLALCVCLVQHTHASSTYRENLLADGTSLSCSVVKDIEPEVLLRLFMKKLDWMSASAQKMFP